MTFLEVNTLFGATAAAEVVMQVTLSVLGGERFLPLTTIHHNGFGLCDLPTEKKEEAVLELFIKIPMLMAFVALKLSY